MRLFDSYSAESGNIISTRPRRFKGEVSRVGVFPYYIDGKLIWQFRPPEEVFAEQSIDSLLDAVMTVNHPDDDEALEVIHGSIYNVVPHPDQHKIDAEFVLMTEDSTNLASRSSPLSPMYDADLIADSGSYMGKNYDLIQRNIRYTSVGLVDRARQGDSVKVFMQLSRDNMLSTTESGIQYIASVITSNDMKVNKKRIADSAAAIADPVAAPAPSAPDATPETTIPTAVTPAELATIAETAPLEQHLQPILADPVVEPAPVTIPPAVTPEAVEKPEDEAEEVVAVVEVEEEEGAEEFVPIAQITTNGGVLVEREFINEVVSVAQVAVEIGAMSLADAMYYGQANIENVQKAVLAHAGLKLSDSDDIGTAYRMYAQNRNNNTVVAPAVKPTKTVAESARSKTVKPPVPQTRATVTHPATRKVADSASIPVTTSDSDLISVDMLNI